MTPERKLAIETFDKMEIQKHDVEKRLVLESAFRTAVEDAREACEEAIACGNCRGSGKVTSTMLRQVDCSECNGTGIRPDAVEAIRARGKA